MPSHVTSSTSDSDILIVHDPVATLVRCDSHIFLCIGEVNAIKIDSDLYSSIALEDIIDNDKVMVSMRVFGVRPATAEDDSTMKNDWRSYQIPELTIHVPGKWIHPINPSLVSRSATVSQQFYLFQGLFLVALAASIFSHVTNLNVKMLVRLTANNIFPYREVSGASTYHILST